MQITQRLNLLLLLCAQLSSSLYAYTLVLDPTGTLHYPGRKLSDSFERGATMQCVEEIKKKLEKNNNSNVIITRSSKSAQTQQQKAQLSNRLQADLYIHLSFFHETEVQPRLFIYRFSYGNDFPAPPTPFTFCPYNQAHCISLELTKKIAKQLHTSLKDSLYAVQPILAVPYAPLMGITAPAFGIEIGLHTTSAWRQCVQPLTDTLTLLNK